MHTLSTKLCLSGCFYSNIISVPKAEKLSVLLSAKLSNLQLNGTDTADDTGACFLFSWGLSFWNLGYYVGCVPN